MSFNDWLKEQYGKTWEELFCNIPDEKLIAYTVEYEYDCAIKNIEPSWL